MPANPMLIISNSMPKSGSTLLWWYTTELVKKACPANGQAALEAFLATESATKQGKRFIKTLDARTLDRLEELTAVHGPMVIKTHAPLTGLIRRRLAAGTVRTTFIHRDPRDVILSAMDHRERTLNREVTFSKEFSSLEGGIAKTLQWCRFSLPWAGEKSACIFRYADLLRDPEGELARLCRHLDLSIDEKEIRAVIAREKRNRQEGKKQFNTGKETRYEAEMSPDEIALCNRKLGRYIEALGYPLPAGAVRRWSFSGLVSRLFGR